jgi:hypothetical protein
VDLDKLRPQLAKDAAPPTDALSVGKDLAGQDRDATALPDNRDETGAQSMGPEVQGEGGRDGVSTGTDGGPPNGDSNDAGDVEGNGGSRAESGSEVATDGVDVFGGADSGPGNPDSLGDSGATEDSDSAADIPANGTSEVADGFAGAGDASDGPADGLVSVEAGRDAFSVDARGKLTCPSTNNGSLDPSDATQVGRLSRVAPTSVCGTAKAFPGNGADTTYPHLYDAYHLINATGAPVCFNFTLTYAGSQQLGAAAYSVFDPTNIASGFLGDVGGVLTSPQTMGMTVGAGATIDMVVFAVAQGTAAAGSYTLACSTN